MFAVRPLFIPAAGNPASLADKPSPHSENWQSGPENHARGVAWLDKIYKNNRTATINSLAAHKDFGTVF